MNSQCVGVPIEGMEIKYMGLTKIIYAIWKCMDDRFSHEDYKDCCKVGCVLPSFGPISEWGSIETKIIGEKHPSLFPNSPPL